MTNRPPTKANILAVDDYPANITALEAVLSSDYNVIPAESGSEAIAIMQTRNDIHVVLMDLQMPGMDGFEAAGKIKKLSGYEDVPIIFITATYKEDPFIKKGYEVGGVDYFSKPFDPEILKMKVGVYSSFQLKTSLLKERERQLQETEDLLRVGRKLSATLESLPVGVLIADVDGRICQTNSLISQICGGELSSDSESYSEAIGWWDSAGYMIKDPNGPLAKAIHLGQTTHNQLIELVSKAGVKKTGVKKTIYGSASPLLGRDGQTLGAVVVLQDVTETKKVEKDLENHITNFISAGVQLEERLGH